MVNKVLKKKDFQVMVQNRAMEEMSKMYLQHELMLAEDQVRRQDMNKKYDDTMKSLSEELYNRKDDRN
jgi:hypothetical protein